MESEAFWPSGFRTERSRVRLPAGTLPSNNSGQITCLCRCTWSSGWCRLVTFRLRFDSHCRSFYLQTTLSKLLTYCAQVNSASYPQQDGKWTVAYGLRGEGLVWLIGAVVCLLAANRGSNCSLMRAMDGRMLRDCYSHQWASITTKVLKPIYISF